MEHPCKKCIVRACCNQQNNCEEYKKLQFTVLNVISPICYLLGLITICFGLMIMLLATNQEYYKYYLGCSWIVPIIIGHYVSKKYDVNPGLIFCLGPLSVGVLISLLLIKTTCFVLIRE